MRHLRGTSAAMLCCLSLLILVGACDEDVVAPKSNVAPQTEVRATSPRTIGEGFAIDFFFTGTDADGRVKFFAWRVLEHPDGDPPWTRTDEADLTLSFPAESSDLGFENPGPTRTFQVRAVDDSGLADSTPAVVSFTPLTLAPQIAIVDHFVSPTSCRAASRAMTFRWTATDMDSKSGAPEFVRYLLKDVGVCLTKAQFESGPSRILSGDEAWSDWIRYDAALDSGRVARFPLRPASDLGNRYFFAVQARDIDGATSRVFTWGEQVAHVFLTDEPAPWLLVQEPTLGTQDFRQLEGVENHDIGPGQELEFRWLASADSFFGEVSDFRYGWDPLDPDDPDDPGWAVDWGDWTEAPLRSFFAGVHTFVVQVRDRANVITRATYVLNVDAALGPPILAFRFYVDVGDDADPVWELRWTGNQDGPYPISPEETPLPFAGFGRRFKIEWEASSPNGAIVGYRYRTGQGSDEFWPADSGGEKQWDLEATSFVFANEVPPADLAAGCGDDAVGCDPALVRFSSGNYDITVEALDAAQIQSDPGAGDLDFAVNYAPETRIIEDASYPRFEVRDGAGELLSSGSIARGDTIPAMSTVFFRSGGFDKFGGELPPGVPADSLCCDTPFEYDPNLYPGDPGYVPMVEYQSRLRTVRRSADEPFGRELSNTFSAPEQGDTISFWTGPLEFTYESRTVDEHRRPDIEAEPFEFVAGFPPRVLESLTIPGGEVSGNPGDAADTLLVNLLAGRSWEDNEIPHTVVPNVQRWWTPSSSGDCEGELHPPGIGQPPTGTVQVYGSLVQVSLTFVGSSDPRDPLSPVNAWSYAIFSDKDPHNWIEDGLESRDLSFFINAPLPNEWEFGPTQTIDIWVPLEVAFNPELYHPTSGEVLKRSIGCIVARQLGEMTIQVRGRTTHNEDGYYLYEGTRKTPGGSAALVSIGEFGRQSETVQLNCQFLVGGGFDGAPLFYWPDF